MEPHATLLELQHSPQTSTLTSTMPPRRSSRIRAQRDSVNKAPLQKPAAPKAKAKRSKPRAKQPKVDVACNIPRASAPPSPPAPLASERPSSPAQAEATAQASRNEPSAPAPVASEQAQPRDPPSCFESLPLDIYLEIARQCDPRSLYHLSKVSKTCRRVLRQPSNRAIWKEVFAAHVNPLPPCPEDIMTELQLAEITYGTDCMVRPSLTIVDACAECTRAGLRRKTPSP